MFVHSLFIILFTLFMLLTYFDAFSEAKCNRHRRNRINCCCRCKKDQEESTTTRHLSFVSEPSFSHPSFSHSRSAVSVSFTSATKPSSIISTNETTTSPSCNFWFYNFKNNIYDNFLKIYNKSCQLVDNLICMQPNMFKGRREVFYMDVAIISSL